MEELVLRLRPLLPFTPTNAAFLRHLPNAHTLKMTVRSWFVGRSERYLYWTRHLGVTCADVRDIYPTNIEEIEGLVGYIFELTVFADVLQRANVTSFQAVIEYEEENALDLNPLLEADLPPQVPPLRLPISPQSTKTRYLIDAHGYTSGVYFKVPANVRILFLSLPNLVCETGALTHLLDLPWSTLVQRTHSDGSRLGHYLSGDICPNLNLHWQNQSAVDNVGIYKITRTTMRLLRMGPGVAGLSDHDLTPHWMLAMRSCLLDQVVTDMGGGTYIIYACRVVQGHLFPRVLDLETHLNASRPRWHLPNTNFANARALLDSFNIPVGPQPIREVTGNFAVRGARMLAIAQRDHHAPQRRRTRSSARLNPLRFG